MKPGDLAITQDMGKGNGKIALIVKVNVYKFHESAPDYTTYDVIINSELIDNIHESFLLPIGEQCLTGKLKS